MDNDHGLELRKLLGQQLGPSDWLCVDQSMISDFGRTTLDPDPLHIDPEWAKVNGPYGGTIAFGFLTVALLTKLLHSATETTVHVDPMKTGLFLNYGFDRMRLISPVKVDSHVRGQFALVNLDVDKKGRFIATFDCTIEIKGEARPALSAQWLTIWIPPAP